MVKELNKIQIEILRKFMYNERLKYNQIWSKDICTSSNFDYQQLQKISYLFCTSWEISSNTSKFNSFAKFNVLNFWFFEVLYHLKVLISDDILKKDDEYYSLTSEGTAFVTSIDGVSIKNKKKPVICSFILAQNDEGKILFSIRKKQPYFDHLNIRNKIRNFIIILKILVKIFPDSWR